MSQRRNNASSISNHLDHILAPLGIQFTDTDLQVHCGSQDGERFLLIELKHFSEPLDPSQHRTLCALAKIGSLARNAARMAGRHDNMTILLVRLPEFPEEPLQVTNYSDGRKLQHMTADQFRVLVEQWWTRHGRHLPVPEAVF